MPNSYKAHVRWLRQFIQALDLKRITLVGQDWGGLTGLRVVAQMPERFSRIVAMNTGIPDGRGDGRAFMQWRYFSQRQRKFDLPVLLPWQEDAGEEVAGHIRAWLMAMPSAQG